MGFVLCLCYFATIYDHLNVSPYTSLHHVSLNLHKFRVWANPGLSISDVLICKKLIANICIYFLRYLICIEISAVNGRDIPEFKFAVLCMIVFLLELDAVKFRYSRGLDRDSTTSEGCRNRIIVCRHLKRRRI